MYSKVYWITCDAGQRDALLEHYDTAVAPAVRASEHHVGHHMVESEPEKWLLVSTYKNAAAAEEAAPMVQELVAPMIEQFGMTLEVLTAGDVLRTV